jgi:uncharacterized protein YndB with AHSA1/START domain
MEEVMSTGTLSVTAKGDREIVMTREFNAPRTLVFDALTKPELIRRWLGGLPGWSMVVCDVDLRVGGAYRYVWRKDGGHEMGMGGIFREVQAPERLVSNEKFDDAWYEGECLGTIVLTERAGRTTLTQTLLYDTPAARDGVLQSPMEQGVAISYDRLDDLLSSSSR